MSWSLLSTVKDIKNNIYQKGIYEKKNLTCKKIYMCGLDKNIPICGAYE
jgi:hypothetical protein